MSRYAKFLSLVLVLAPLFVSAPAFASKNIALVLANSAYENVPPLANAVNDGNAVEQALKEADFEVISYHDLAAQDTRRALREFADQARDADIVVVYYAGHGIELEGSNYIIPVDAKLERDTDVYDETFSVDRVLMATGPAKQLRLIILDACRDNPFMKTMQRQTATRRIGRGLARVEPENANTLIAYSAKAGSVALDGNGKNSPFATALVKYLTIPGLDVRRAFGFVRDEVLKTTGAKQEPYVYGSLGGEEMPLVQVKTVAPPAPLAPAAPAPDPQAEVRHDYELAMQLETRQAWEAFLAQHSEGFYADLARLQVEKLAAEQAKIAAIVADQAREDGDRAPTKTPAATVERPRVDLAAVAPAKEGNATQDASGSSVDLIKSTQTELHRVGCFSGPIDGEWDAASRRSLSLFNRYAGTSFDVKLASFDALVGIKTKQARVCPLVCEHGFKADGERCTRIVCGDGYVLNDDNECEKRRGKSSRAANHDRDVPLQAERPAPMRSEASARGSRSSRGGQLYCDNNICRPVSRGCHLEYRGGGGPGNAANAEVCN